MKGEFEQRLRQVIDEVQVQPEADHPVHRRDPHAGRRRRRRGHRRRGQPAQARAGARRLCARSARRPGPSTRSTSRRIPALTRRFQVVQVDEPDEAKAILMLRGVATVLEKHHRVQLLDEAIEAAVQLSHRYIPARQLARQGGQPARHRLRPGRDQPARDAARGRGLRSAGSRRWRPSWRSSAARKRSASAIGDRKTDAQAKLDAENARLAVLNARWQEEKVLVDQILELRATLREGGKAVDLPRRSCARERRTGGAAPGERPAVRRRACRDAASAAVPREQLLADAEDAAGAAGRAAGRGPADPAVGRRAGGGDRGRRLDRHPGRADGEERDRGGAAASPTR